MSQSIRMLQSEAFEPSEGSVDFLRIAWRRKSLVALGATIFLVLGGLYFVKAPPVYESTAQVLVVNRSPAGISGAGGAGQQAHMDDFASAHVTLVRSPLIVGRAVAEEELARLDMFADAEDVTGAIIESLAVQLDRSSTTKTASSTNILELAFRGADPDHCATVLNAIIASYQKFLDETFENANEDSLKLLTQKAEELHETIREKESEYRQFRREAPLIWKGKAGEGTGLQVERLASVESEIAALRIRRAELQSRLKAIRTAREAGEDEAALLAMVSEWSWESDGTNRDPIAMMSERLLPLILEEQRLLQDFGPGHPQVQSVRDQIKLTREFFARSFAFRGNAAENLDHASASADPVESCVRFLEQELRKIGNSEQALSNLLEEEKTEIKQLEDFEFSDNQYLGDIGRSEQFYESLIAQLQGLNVGKDLGGYSTSIIAPAAAGLRVGPKAVLIFPLALFLGLLSGYGLAWAAEVSDKSFRTPAEIRRQLGVPVLGHIGFITPATERVRGAAGAMLDPMLCTFHRSKSTDAEAFRGVRTNLYFSTRGEAHKVIQITSTDSGDGKSTLAANLAVSIAQSGRQVVLVDADLRKPRQHKLFGAPNRQGLATLITEQTELPDAVCETVVPGLSLIPSGPVPPNPAELLTSPRFEEFLELVRQQYDFVIVDSPPLLAVSDPSIVAARVDGVLLTLRLSRTSRPKAERAAEILDGIGTTVLGIVVNGVVAGSTGYGGYEYGYGYGDNESYYPDQSSAGETRFDDEDAPTRTNGAPA